MTDGRPTFDATEEEFRAVLTGEHPGLRGVRRMMRRFPTDPRCKLCWAPFEGLGGQVLRHIGYARFGGNPSLCEKCIREFKKAGLTGATIPVTLLFADIRGSTGIGERLSPAEFRTYLDRFYRIGSAAIIDRDGLVDKTVGDEIIGLFFGGVTGPGHAAAAIEAAERLLTRVAAPDATPMGPIPVGAGVHTGEAYVGTTGSPGAPEDFTAVGDIVNATARLAAAAAAGELLLSVDAARAAGRALDDAERRELELRGRHEPLEVVVLRPTAPVPTSARAS